MLRLTDNEIDRIARRVVELLRGEPELMTTRQCAEWLGITPAAVRSRVSEGRIAAHKQGGRLFFDKREITALYFRSAHATGRCEDAERDTVQIKTKTQGGRRA